MGCDSFYLLMAFRNASFNPRTHMGCDDKDGGGHVVCGVSIHAPTWGATRLFSEVERSFFVSIHAPTWGATISPTAARLSDEFQSTHPHGVRLYARGYRSFSQSFNPRTHMGCDFSSLSTFGRGRGFNPRTHMGCDRAARLSGQKMDRFQSTHPHGVRRRRKANYRLVQWFQSTHPHGVRRILLQAPVKGDEVSIHAPTWGAT